MKAKIAILPGDGVGPEIVAEAVKVLDAVARRFGHDFEMMELPVGGAAYDTCGDCLPENTGVLQDLPHCLLNCLLRNASAAADPQSDRPRNQVKSALTVLRTFSPGDNNVRLAPVRCPLDSLTVSIHFVFRLRCFPDFSCRNSPDAAV